MNNVILREKYTILLLERWEQEIFRNSQPQQYKEYFDVIASLYIDRKIEKKSQVEKLFKKLTGRGTAAKSAINLINKYKNNRSVKGIIK